MIDTHLLAELRIATTRRLLPLLGQVMEKTDDALFDVWQQGTGGNSQQVLFDALRELRRQRSVIEGAVGQRIGESFVALGKPPRQGDDDEYVPASPDLEFSLLDSDVLEEQLTCDRLAAAVERRHTDAFARLLRGLSQVAGRPDLTIVDTPLSPLRIARGWRDALAPVLEKIEWRLVAFKHLERQLISDLGAVIDEVCKVMVARGIVITQPSMRPRRMVMPASSGAGRPGPGGPAAWDGGDNQVPQRVFSQSLSNQDMDNAAFFASNAMDMAGGAGFGGGMGGNEGPDPVYEAMREMFAAYLGNVRNSPAALNKPDAGQTQSATPKIDSASAVVVLSRLQRQPTAALLAAVDDRQVEFVNLLRGEIVNTAIALGRAPAGAQMEAHDEQGLTMVGMLFDTLLDQGHFSREVRERLVRLYVPYAKVALLDRRMFAHKLHPARRLLNLLAESSDGNAGDAPAERELLTKVFSVSERLIDSFEEDVAVFTAAEAEFSDFLSRHRRRIGLAEQRAAEAQRGRERLEEARLEVTLELDSLVGKRQVPRPIGDFFRRDWTHHLTMVALRDGVESDAFRDARAPGVKLWMALLACEAGTPPPLDLGEQLLPAMMSAGQGEDIARTALADVIAALRASMPKPVPVAVPAPVAVEAAQRPERGSPPALEQLALEQLAHEQIAAVLPTTGAEPLNAAARAGSQSAQVPLVPVAASNPKVAAAAAVPASVSPINAPAAVEAVESAPQFELVSAAPEPSAMTKTSAVIDGDIKLDADTSRALPELIEQVKQLTVGTWVEFVQADGSIQQAKLSWISPISSRMLFVNRRGLRMCTLSVEELAALMADNKLSLRQTDSAFDRAMTQVLDQLRSGATPTTA
ncbi:MAG: DUF1631 family protein [Pseudomarimonas sp.]